MNYTILFLILGALLVYVGISTGGFALFLTWFGASLCILGSGYAGMGPKVLGKDESGKIKIWAKVVHFPLFIYTWFVWYMLRLISREPAYNHIDENLLIGRRLLPAEMPSDLKNYIDLTSEFDEPTDVIRNLNYICLPILDGSVPGIKELDQTLSRIGTGKTFIHCAQGHGRTALFTIALLSKQKKISHYEEGIKLLKKSRPALRLNKKQVQFIQRYLES